MPYFSGFEGAESGAAIIRPATSANSWSDTSAVDGAREEFRSQSSDSVCNRNAGYGAATVRRTALSFTSTMAARVCRTSGPPTTVVSVSSPAVPYWRRSTMPLTNSTPLRNAPSPKLRGKRMRNSSPYRLRSISRVVMSEPAICAVVRSSSAWSIPPTSSPSSCSSSSAAAVGAGAGAGAEIAGAHFFFHFLRGRISQSVSASSSPCKK